MFLASWEHPCINELALTSTWVTESTVKARKKSQTTSLLGILGAFGAGLLCGETNQAWKPGKVTLKFQQWQQDNYGRNHTPLCLHWDGAGESKRCGIGLENGLDTNSSPRRPLDLQYTVYDSGCSCWTTAPPIINIFVNVCYGSIAYLYYLCNIVLNCTVYPFLFILRNATDFHLHLYVSLH